MITPFLSPVPHFASAVPTSFDGVNVTGCVVPTATTTLNTSIEAHVPPLVVNVV